MRVITRDGDEISATVTDPELDEIVQSEDGELYQVVEISDDHVVVELVEVEEDWGE